MENIMLEDLNDQESDPEYNLFSSEYNHSFDQEDIFYPLVTCQVTTDFRMSQNSDRKQFWNDENCTQERFIEHETEAMRTPMDLEDNEAAQYLDLSYKEELKISLEKLSQESANIRLNLEKNRELINKHNESNEKLSNQLEMLIYNRSVSFNIYSELKECSECLMDEQKKILTLIKGTELNYHHVESFVSTCKFQMDQVIQAVEKQKLLYSFSLQDIKNKGSKALTSYIAYLNRLEKLNELLQSKMFELNAVDEKPLDNCKTSLKNILDINHQLASSLKEEIVRKEQLEMEISQNKENEKLTADKLNESINFLKNEINAKESSILSNLINEKTFCQTKLDDVINETENVKSDTEALDHQVFTKEKVKTDAEECISKLYQTSSDSKQTLERLSILESQTALKHEELKKLKTKFDQLNSEVHMANSQLVINHSKFNQIQTLKSSMEEDISLLRTSYESLESNIKAINNSIEEKLQENVVISNQIKECDEKYCGKEYHYKKKKESLLSIANDLRRNYEVMEQKLNELNNTIKFLNNETNTKQNELNRIHCEMMSEKEIHALIKEKDVEEQEQTIAKYRQLKDLLDVLDEKISDHSKTNDYLLDIRNSLTLQHQSELEDKKKSYEDMKNQLSSQIRFKQKELSSTNIEDIKLSHSAEELNFLLAKIKNNKSLYDCKEVMLKSHFKWAAKQFTMYEAVTKKPAVFKLPKDGQKEENCIIKSQEKVAPPQSKGKINATKETKSNIRTRTSTPRKPPLKNETPTSSLPTIASASDKKVLPEIIKDTGKKGTIRLKANEEKKILVPNIVQTKSAPKKPLSQLNSSIIVLNSDSEPISPIKAKDDGSSHKKQTIRLSTPIEPNTSIKNKIPFFMDLLKKANKSIHDENFITTESSTYDSASTIDMKEMVKKEPILPSTSTPLKDLEHDSDYSFNKSLKQTNKVILKSRMIHKGRAGQQGKKANVNTVICLDSD